jgi:hypothetical protein
MLIMKTMGVSGFASLMDFAPAEVMLPADKKHSLQSACFLVMLRHFFPGAISYV